MTRVVQARPHTDVYQADFDRLVSTRAATEPDWLQRLRRTGIERFADVGFPTSHDEDWKYTSVAPVTSRSFTRAQGRDGDLDSEDVDRWAGSLGGYRLVLVNGTWAPDLSAGALPPGVHVSGMRSVVTANPAALEPYLGRLARPDGQAFAALNTAFFGDGAFVWIPPGLIVEEPISVVFVSTSPSTAQELYARLLVVAGEGSQARIVETYVGAPGHEYFTNAVTEVFVGPSAVIDHYKVQRESRRGFHLADMHVDVARAGVFSSHSMSFGGLLVRNEVVAVLGGEGADCTLNGLYLANGRRHVDNRTTIDHAKPHCGSHELYKGVLGGHARAVFNGRIVVRPDAQKTDAKQTNKALLLSDEAQINTKPQLEIFANDVKCTHGAAVGQLDEDAVFYLRSRGLDLQQARDMLIHAFASDVLDRMRIASLKVLLEAQLFQELPEAP